MYHSKRLETCKHPAGR
ncbi:hypothetical protein LINGRAHAP2_LOCUS32285 [Linum grandiflorum]